MPTKDEILELTFAKGFHYALDVINPDYFSCPVGGCITFSDYELDYGILKQRESPTTINNALSGGGPSYGLYYWIDNSQGSGRVGNIYMTALGNVYRSDAYTAGGSGVALTNITNGVQQPTAAPVTWASLNGILVYTGASGVGGIQPVQITSHTANASSLAGAPQVGIVRTVGNFMFGSGTWLQSGSATNSRVWWSNVADPTTWGATNFVDFRVNDGDLVVALGELNGNLLIFKQRSIGMLSTTTQVISGAVTLAPLSTLFQGIGGLSPNAVDNLPDGRCAFIGSDFQVYITDGMILDCITKNAPPIPSIAGAILGSAAFSSATEYFLRYSPRRNEIIFGIATANPSVTAPFVMAYDLSQKYWRQITGINPRGLAVVSNAIVARSTMIFSNGSLGPSIFNLSGAITSPPTDEAGVSVTPSASTSVILPPNFMEQGFVWLTILYSSSNAVTYTYGFDGTYKSNQTLSAANHRADVKILLSGSTTFQTPTTFQLKFVDTGGANIYKCWLSRRGTT